MTCHETEVIRKINSSPDFNDRNAIDYSKTITAIALYNNYYPLTP